MQIYAAQERVICRVANDAVPSRTKAHRIAKRKPKHCRPGERDEALHHDGKHVLALNQTAVEECKSRCHQHDETRAEQHECCITCINVCHDVAPPFVVVVRRPRPPAAVAASIWQREMGSMTSLLWCSMAASVVDPLRITLAVTRAWSEDI